MFVKDVSQSKTTLDTLACPCYIVKGNNFVTSSLAAGKKENKRTIPFPLSARIRRQKLKDFLMSLCEKKSLNIKKETQQWYFDCD